MEPEQRMAQMSHESTFEASVAMVQEREDRTYTAGSEFLPNSLTDLCICQEMLTE